MSNKNFKGQAIIPTIILLNASIIILNVFLSVRFIGFSNSLIDEKLAANIESLKLYLEESQANTRASAESMAMFKPDVIKAVKQRDRDALLHICDQSMLDLYRIDYFTISDSEGRVLLRTYDPDKKGDFVLNQQNVKDAMAGKVSTYFEKGTEIKVAVRTGAPVYDDDGSLIGVISAGIRLDQDSDVNILRNLFHSEVTVYLGNERIASTIVMDGKSVIGTELDPRVAKIVLENKDVYSGDADVLGEKYKTFYMPLLNSQNEAFAAISLGMPMAKLITQTNIAILQGIVIGVAGLIVFFILLFLISNEKRQLKQMVNEIKHRDTLLGAGNRLAASLLSAAENEKFENSLLSGVEYIGVCMDVDRVQIWQNETINGSLSFVHKYQWLSDVGRQKVAVPIGLNFPYTAIPEWKELFLNGGHINAPLSALPQGERGFLDLYEMKSIVIIPMFLHDKFWGFFSLDDCVNERTFSGDEIDILRSAGLMMINALLRQEMTQSILDANNAKSSFLAKMSHEMRTPLNAIIGLSELTLEAGGIDEEAGINLEKVNNAGRTLLTTVNDILDISKIEAGKFELISVEYDIPSVINDTVTQSILHIGEKPIQFLLNVDEKLPALLIGDELRIRQICNNLMSNSFKYTREGEVELKVSYGGREGDTDWVIAQVRDTGIGIKPENIGNLFDEYAQMDTKANRKIMGTGLGLPIVKKMVELMGGSISVTSDYGKGSTFTVRLPQKHVTDKTIGPELANNLKNFKYTDQKRRQESKLNRIKLPYARVLVVDDVITNLDVARGLMKPYGMRVDCVSSGQEAIDAIRNESIRYNAVFMDHMMPEMDGIEATRIIREEIGTEYAKTVPVIALTANAIIGNEDMFLSKGFQAFISKPIEIASLDTVIHHWVRDKEYEQKMGDGELAGSREQGAGSPPPQTTNYKLPTIQGLDINKGIERFGDTDAYFDILRSYAVNTPPLLETMKRVSTENLAAYAITVHGIKGASRGILAEAVGSKAEALEHASKANDLDFVSANNDAFLEMTWKLITDIKALLDKINSAHPRQKKDKPDKETLEKLLAACVKYDMDSVDAAIEEIDAYEYTSDDGLALWLKENVEQMNFKQIIERLSALGG
ncbi:MAG: cache domain-containing protein [Treponema sp.]|jgi:signal transduction histidine kinase/CheY-like chemotaxis protein|nr:cache domain-containing protein [Treponema sp.]